MIDLLLLKTIGEVVGCLFAVTSFYFLGRPGKMQMIGLWISTASFIPWTVFALCTNSWFFLAQNVAITSINLFNLYSARRRAASVNP